MKKKIFLLFVIFLLIVNSVAFAIEPDSLQSKSAVMINSDDRQILFEKNANDKLPPASITKIMLLVLVSEKLHNNEIKLTDEVTISGTAASMGGSQVFLEEYEIQTVENLLKAICLRSANDASVAMAEFLYGSEEGCVKIMNERAKEIKMENTSFANVTGLPDQNHYTTAYDISLMTSELLKYDYVNKYMTTWMDSIFVGKGKNIEQVLVNTNKLVNNYDGLLGGKTGYTQEAKYCLSAAAMRNNTKLIAVVLGCDDTKVRFAEIKKILNDGFANYKNIMFCEKYQPVAQVPIRLADSDIIDAVTQNDVFELVKSEAKKEDYNIEYVMQENLKAPIDKNTVIGMLTVTKNGTIIKEAELFPKDNVPKQSFARFFAEKTIHVFLK